jgi:hypothetical protein
MNDLAFQALWQGLTGQLGIKALIVFWVEALLALLGFFLLIEIIVVRRRTKQGETIWSALTSWGDRRTFKLVDEQPTYIPEETSVEIVRIETLELPSLQQQSMNVTLPEKLPEPSQAVVPEVTEKVSEPKIRIPVQQKAIKFDVEASADMVEVMFKVKTGIIRLLWEHRAIEESAGNVAGMQAIDVLLADIENTEVQKVWVLGDAKTKMLGG